MSKNRLLKILLPSIALSFGGQAIAYTLQEAVGHTLATSPDFFIQTNVRDKIDKQLREAYADYLPTLDLAAGWGEQYTNNTTTRVAPVNPVTGRIIPGPVEGTRTLTRTEFSLIASQMLFDGFAVYHNVEGNKARVRAEAWRTNDAAQETALRAVEAYLRVILERELVQYHRENLSVHDRIFGQIHKRSEGGIGRKADLDQADGRVALARTNLLAEEANLRDAETDFLRTIGIPTPSHLVRPEEPHNFPSSESVAIELALARHPELRSTFEDIMVKRAENKGARAPFVPRFDLQLGMTRNYNIDGALGANDDNTAMLRMRWNLFRGGKDLAKICRTAAEMQEAQEVQNRAHREVVQTTRFAWTIYTTAKKSMPYYRTHVDAGIRTREAYQKQFNIGQRTLLDLLDSQNELLSAQVALAEGRNKELLGMYRVLNATGGLTEYLGVPLPRQVLPVPTGIMAGAARFFDKDTTIFY